MTNIFRGYIYKAVNLFFITLVIVGGVAGGSKAEAQVSGGLVNAGFEDPGTDKKTAAGWLPFDQGYKRAARAHTGAWGINVQSDSFSGTAGAYQRIDLQQSELKPVQITGYVKGNSIVAAPGSWFGASLYAEVHLQNGTVVYWNSVPNFGTFGWRWIGFNTGTLAAVNQPIDHIYIVPLIGNATGQAWFDDIAVKEFEPGTGAVSIMFDDGELNTYEEALPLLEEYGWSGTTAVITDMVGEEGFMGWKQLQQLQQKGWEIVSHGISHSDLTTLSLKEQRREFRQSKRILGRKGLSVNHFALPYGAYNSSIMSMGAGTYQSVRAYEQGSNAAGTLPWEVKVHGVTASTTRGTVAQWINEAQAQGRWIVVVYHKVAESGDDAYYTTPEDFREMLETIKDSGVDVLTYNQGWEKFGSR